MGTVPNVLSNNGVAIPQLGFGVFRVPVEETRSAVASALAAGYRHIDTAASYNNEAGVGEAIAASGLAREDIFITTKLQIPGQQDPTEAFERSRLALGVEYVDLYLIHWPAPARNLFVTAWKTLEGLYAAGRVRAIGVSNFLPHHLDTLLRRADVVPAVNQIELHPTLQQREPAAKSRSHGIMVEAFSPLGKGADLSSPAVQRIAASRRATPAQIVLAWNLNQGNIVIPKSVNPARMQENLQSVEIALSREELDSISAMEAGNRLASHPDSKS